MNDIVTVIKSLRNMRCLTPATEDAVKKAERDLNLSFADDYSTYLINFGVASGTGIELTGLIDSKRLNVVEVTKKARRLYKKFPDYAYVIENSGVNGMLIIQDGHGTIYSILPGGGAKRLCGSLAEYVSFVNNNC